MSSGIILPGGGNGVANPALETMKAPIGGVEVEFFKKPGVGAQVEVPDPSNVTLSAAPARRVALSQVAALCSQSSMVIQALLREAVSLREEIEELKTERTRDRADFASLAVKVETVGGG